MDRIQRRDCSAERSSAELFILHRVLPVIPVRGTGRETGDAGNGKGGRRWIFCCGGQKSWRTDTGCCRPGIIFLPGFPAERIQYVFFICSENWRPGGIFCWRRSMWNTGSGVRSLSQTACLSGSCAPGWRFRFPSNISGSPTLRKRWDRERRRRPGRRDIAFSWKPP